MLQPHLSPPAPPRVPALPVSLTDQATTPGLGVNTAPREQHDHARRDSTVHITVAGPAEHGAVDALRVSAYRGAPYFDIRDSTLLHMAHDPPCSLVLCAWDSAELVSTVRLAVTADWAESEELLGCDLPVPVGLPAAVFSRGAVNPHYRGQGWMPFMLTMGLRFAMRLTALCALGAQATGTPHQRAMLRAGWRVQDVGHLDHGAMAMKSTMQFLWLPASAFDAALQHGFEEGGALLARCALASLRGLPKAVDAFALRHRLLPRPVVAAPTVARGARLRL
jgi:hypothetical protein